MSLPTPSAIYVLNVKYYEKALSTLVVSISRRSEISQSASRVLDKHCHVLLTQTQKPCLVDAKEFGNINRIRGQLKALVVR
jgi:hypothetical protein